MRAKTYSAAVALHGLLVAQACLLRVLPEFAPRPALAQQIPALVERDLNAPEPLAVGIGCNTSGFAVEQFMLLARQPVDGFCHPAFFHAVSPSAFWARTLRLSVS